MQHTERGSERESERITNITVCVKKDRKGNHKNSVKFAEM